MSQTTSRPNNRVRPQILLTMYRKSTGSIDELRIICFRGLYTRAAVARHRHPSFSWAFLHSSRKRTKHGKKRKKSRFFGFSKNVKNVFSNYAFLWSIVTWEWDVAAVSRAAVALSYTINKDKTSSFLNINRVICISNSCSRPPMLSSSLSLILIICQQGKQEAKAVTSIADCTASQQTI